MTTYTATIRHHSISRARVITITGTLAQAKRAASKEFGGEMPDCTIRIEQAHDGYPSQPIANKRVGAARWSSYLNTPPQHHTPRSHTMTTKHLAAAHQLARDLWASHDRRLRAAIAFSKESHTADELMTFSRSNRAIGDAERAEAIAAYCAATGADADDVSRYLPGILAQAGCDGQDPLAGDRNMWALGETAKQQAAYYGTAA